MIVIGLTGSVAMGKSEVANVFRAHGIPVFDADRAVHDLYDSEAGARLVAPLAPEAVADGKVDRTILSRSVLADPTLLSRLEPLIHGEVRKIRDRFLDQARQEGRALVVIDIPLLFETNAEKGFDKVIVVSADADTQRQRALARPGMTKEKLEMIRARQMPDGEKRNRADIIIENSGSLADLQSRVTAIILDLQQELNDA
jgi:dephospho-CoA kinase